MQFLQRKRRKFKFESGEEKVQNFTKKPSQENQKFDGGINVKNLVKAGLANFFPLKCEIFDGAKLDSKNEI